jgi:glycosyltransferase involved in cell wall biosynthesis
MGEQHFDRCIKASGKVAFITNISQERQSGGFSGMSSAMAAALAPCCSLTYVPPINPKPRLWEHVISKSRRLLGLKGAFFFFSEARLRDIAKETERHVSDIPHDVCFFHGFTPWIHFHPSKPYVCWSDCTFPQYMSIFHDQTQFCEKDLERIKMHEADWLKRASLVLFRNQWAAKTAIAEYGLERNTVGYVGNYGLIDPPPIDSFDNGWDFLFASTNFQLKGGFTVINAFHRLRKNYPHIRLVIVGDAPPRSISSTDGAFYVGSLRKEIPEERTRLSAILASARALVHPTKADTNPMILIEAGYFGCPSISTRMCGIPEIIEDGVTGLLLDFPASADSLADAMERIIIDDETYRLMRQAVRERMLRLFSREVFEDRVRKQLTKVLPSFTQCDA